jgi:CheY-like chemotaxis protein
MSYSGPIKILYVEDEAVVRMVAAEALRDAGFDVIEAQTADEAILLLADPDHVSILFTDISLPGTMDGIDLAHETRQAYPSMPVLVASGYAEQIHERLGDLSPPAKFMAKPFSLDKVIETVQGLTRGL